MSFKSLTEPFYSCFESDWNMVLDTVGYLGGFLIAISLAPQLLKTWKTKSAKDLSLLWTLIALTGLILYAIYAAMNFVLPLLTFALVESVMVVALVIMKVKYDKSVTVK